MKRYLMRLESRIGGEERYRRDVALARMVAVESIRLGGSDSRRSCG